MKVMIILITLCVILISCKNRNKQTSLLDATNVKADSRKIDTLLKDQLMFLDVTKDYEKKEFVIQDIADVEYIPLETRSDVLLSLGLLSSVYVSDSLIITYSRRQETVFVFNRKGKIINTFSRIGRGPGEYQSLSELTVDFDREEIYIYDHPLSYRILVYDYDGELKRTLKLSGIWITALQNYDADYLWGCDKRNCNDLEIEKANKQPYFFISKTDGRSIPLELFFEKQMHPVLFYSKWKEGENTLHSATSRIHAFSMFKNGDMAILGDWSSDTIYSVENRTLKPSIVKIPSGMNHTPQILNRVFLRTDRYTFVSSVKKLPATSAKDLATKTPYTSFVCDHYTHTSYKSSFVNDDYVFDKNINIQSMGTEMPANYARYWFAVSRLLKEYEAGKLSGKLKEIASNLKEDDNPVLMLVKFKE